MKNEIERRRNLGRESQKQRKLIASKYIPLHPHVYTLKVNIFFVVRARTSIPARPLGRQLSHFSFSGPFLTGVGQLFY